MDVMLGLIKNLENKYNPQVQYLCYDNPGENVVFKKACKQKDLKLEFEYTATGTPQQNDCLEQKFATLIK